MRPLFLLPFLVLACGGANDDVLAESEDEIRAEQCPKGMALALEAPDLTAGALTHAEDARALTEEQARSASILRTILGSDGWRRDLDLPLELTKQNRIRCVYEVTASVVSAELRGRGDASSLEISRKPFLYRVAPRAYSTSGLELDPAVRAQVFAELEGEGGGRILVKLGESGIRQTSR